MGGRKRERKKEVKERGKVLERFGGKKRGDGRGKGKEGGGRRERKGIGKKGEKGRRRKR